MLKIEHVAMTLSKGINMMNYVELKQMATTLMTQMEITQCQGFVEV